MTADAVKRLEAIESIQDLGAGFTLATHDMEIRGAGELLGGHKVSIPLAPGSNRVTIDVDGPTGRSIVGEHFVTTLLGDADLGRVVFLGIGVPDPGPGLEAQAARRDSLVEIRAYAAPG